MKLVVCILAASLLSLAQISAPVAGIIRDRFGALRPVLGVGGAFVLGEPLATGIVFAAFSGKVGVAKSEAEVIVFNSDGVKDRRPAPAGPIAVEWDKQGQPARAWFPEAKELWVWTSNGVVTEHRESDPELRDALSPMRAAAESLPSGTVEQMSDQWLVVHADGVDVALRTQSGRTAAVRLPEAAQ